MRLIITGVNVDGKRVSVLDHTLHTVAIDVITDQRKESIIMQLAEEIISTLKAYTFRKL